jgi:hypothetical protein
MNKTHHVGCSIVLTRGQGGCRTQLSGNFRRINFRICSMMVHSCTASDKTEPADPTDQGIGCPAYVNRIQTLVIILGDNSCLDDDCGDTSRDLGKQASRSIHRLFVLDPLFDQSLLNGGNPSTMQLLGPRSRTIAGF